MRKGGGRNKGSAFERETAKAIVAAFAHLGITNEDVYRTPGSGGHRYAKKEDPADLVISKRLRKHWPFSVECKHYAKISMDLLMVPHVKAGVLKDWWEQCVGSAGKYVPLLVFRQNRQQAYAMLPYDEDHGTFRLTPFIKTRVAGHWVYVVRFKSLLRFYKKRTSE